MSDSAGSVTDPSVLRGVGVSSAVATTVLSAVAFGVAVTTPPRTGPFAAPGAAIALRVRKTGVPVHAAPGRRCIMLYLLQD